MQYHLNSISTPAKENKNIAQLSSAQMLRTLRL